MIDTDEVLDIASEYCTEEEFEVIARAMVELDRLYEIERRNTPLTREQIEAKMIRHGMFISKTNDNTRVVLNVPFSAVTLQLLDAVLEGK